MLHAPWILYSRRGWPKSNQVKHDLNQTGLGVTARRRGGKRERNLFSNFLLLERILIKSNIHTLVENSAVLWRSGNKWHNNDILTASVCDSRLNYTLETSFQNNNYASSIHEFHLPPLFYNCTHLSDVLIIFIKRLSILPVVKCSYAHDVFFFVDNRQGQDIFNDPASFIYRSFLQTKKTQVIFQVLVWNYYIFTGCGKRNVQRNACALYPVFFMVSSCAIMVH